MILLLKRSEKISAPGLWSLPGDGLEPGEDAVESILREVVQETGITLETAVPFCSRAYTDEGENIVLIGYQAAASTSKIVLN